MKITMKQLKSLISEQVKSLVEARIKDMPAPGWHFVYSDTSLSRQVFASKEEALAAAEEHDANLRGDGQSHGVNGVVLVSQPTPFVGKYEI